MSLNPVKEEFDRAYANVGLLASDVWSYQSQLSNYKVANLYLWIRLNEVNLCLLTEDVDSTALTESISKFERSPDIVPLSGQDSYAKDSFDGAKDDLYIYNGFSEVVHETDDVSPEGTEIWMSPEGTEIWMSPEVELELNYYADVNPYRLFQVGQDIAPAKQVTTACPSKWLSHTKWPSRLLHHYPDLALKLQDPGNLSLFKEDIHMPCYSIFELLQKLDEFPSPSFQIENSADLELYTRISSLAVRSQWTSHQSSHANFKLNAEIPEFQPANNRPLQYQSIYDTSYKADLFPYMNMAQDLSNMHFKKEGLLKTLPAFSSPPNSYKNFENIKSSWESQQQEIFPSLQPDGSSSVRSLSPEETIALLDKWLSKIYNPRSNDFMAISLTSHKIDTVFQNVHHNYLISQNGAMRSCCSNGRFDQLEREAWEQYNTQASKRNATEECGRKASRQPMWINKKKKKSEKKKKCSKHKSRCAFDSNTYYNYYDCIDYEIALIHRFVKHKRLFSQTFLSSDWESVQPLLTDKAASYFNLSLKMTQNCSEWFNILILQNDLKTDFKNRKRLELSKNILDSQKRLLNILNMYISYYSKIRMTFSCDSMIFLDSNNLHNHKPILSVNYETMKCLSIMPFDEYFEIFSRNKAITNQYSYNFTTCDTIKQEWQLLHRPETCINTNFFSLQVKNENCVYHYIFDQTQPTMCKILRWAEGCPEWCTWQWMYIDGWKFTDNDSFFSFNWFNQFTVSSLQKTASFAHNLIFDEWMFEFLISFNKIRLIWNIENVNYTRSDVVFMTLLLKQKKMWSFNLLRLNRYPCVSYNRSSGNNCCFSWLLNSPSATVKEFVGLNGCENQMGSRTAEEYLSNMRLISEKIARENLSVPKNGILKTELKF